MYSMKRTSRGRPSVKATKSRSSSSFRPRITTQFTLSGNEGTVRVSPAVFFLRDGRLVLAPASALHPGSHSLQLSPSSPWGWKIPCGHWFSLLSCGEQGQGWRNWAKGSGGYPAAALARDGGCLGGARKRSPSRGCSPARWPCGCPP